MIRRIAWRLQVLAEGDLSQRAKERATELARDAGLRVIPPHQKGAAASEPAARGGTKTGALPEPKGDDRLPLPGSVLAGTPGA